MDFLLIADVHAGKASHFRKSGIPLSTDHLLQDLLKIESLIDKTKPKKVIVLGDLFHTRANQENHLVDNWISSLKIPFELIMGNHDVYSVSENEVNKQPYSVNNVHLSHEPTPDKGFNIFGHLHPAYSVVGKARQHIKLACFYVSENFITLPSFGSVTGKRVYKNILKEAYAVIITEEGLLKMT